MLIYFYNSNIELTGIIDDFINLSYTRSFTGVGDWSLRIREEDLPVISASSYMKIDDDRSGLITGVEQVKDAGGHNITVNGLELKGLAQKRVLMPLRDGSFSFENPVEPSLIAERIIQYSLTDPSDTKRKINGRIINSCSTQEAIDFESKYGNAATEIQNLCEAYGFGWTANIVNNEIVWLLYEGVDRTLDQTANEPLILSFADDTLTSETMESAINALGNTAVVGGKGEGSSRTVITVNDENTGLQRNEFFVDARNDDDDKLEETGKAKIAEYGTDTTITIEPSLYIQNNLGILFNLGDYGTMRERGINLQLTEVTDTYENVDHKTQFTFGFDANTIQSALKRLTGNYNSVVAKEAYSGGSGGGAVDSVNGYTGHVVLDADDVGADDKGKVTVDNTVYTLRMGSSGAAGYITFKAVT